MDAANGEKQAKEKSKDKSKKRKKDKTQEESQAQAGSVDAVADSVQSSQDAGSTAKTERADTSKVVDGQVSKKRRRARKSDVLPASSTDIMNSLMLPEDAANEPEASSYRGPSTSRLAGPAKSKLNGTSEPGAPGNTSKSTFMELNTSTADVLKQMKERRNKAKTDEKGKGRAREADEVLPVSETVADLSALTKKARKASRRKVRSLGDTSHAGTPDSAETLVIHPNATSILPENLTKPSFSGHVRFVEADIGNQASRGEKSIARLPDKHEQVDPEVQKTNGKKRPRETETDSVNANDMSTVSTASAERKKRKKKGKQAVAGEAAASNVALRVEKPAEPSSAALDDSRPRDQPKTSYVESLILQRSSAKASPSVPVSDTKVPKSKKHKKSRTNQQSATTEETPTTSVPASPATIVRTAIASLAGLSGSQILEKATSTSYDKAQGDMQPFLPVKASEAVANGSEATKAAQSAASVDDQEPSDAQRDEEKRLRKEAKAEKRRKKEEKQLKRALKAEQAQKAEEAARVAEEEQARAEAARQAEEAEAERMRQAETERVRREKARQLQEKAAKRAKQEAIRKAAQEAARAIAAKEAEAIAEAEDVVRKTAAAYAAHAAEKAARRAAAEEAAKAEAEKLVQEKLAQVKEREKAKAEKFRLKEEKKQEKEARKAAKASKEATEASIHNMTVDGSNDSTSGEASRESEPVSTQVRSRRLSARTAQSTSAAPSRPRAGRATGGKSDTSKASRSARTILFDEPSDADALSFSMEQYSGSEFSDLDDEETYIHTLADEQESRTSTSRRRPSWNSKPTSSNDSRTREHTKTPAKDFTTTPSTVRRSLRPRNVYGKASSATPAPTRKKQLPTSSPVAQNAEDEEEDEIISTADDSESHYVAATASVKPKTKDISRANSEQASAVDNDESSMESAEQMEEDDQAEQQDELSAEEEELEAPPSGQGPPSDVTMEVEQTAELSTTSEPEEEEEQEEAVKPQAMDDDIVLETPEPEEDVTAAERSSEERSHQKGSDANEETHTELSQKPASEPTQSSETMPSSSEIPLVPVEVPSKARRPSILQPPKTPASPRRSNVEVLVFTRPLASSSKKPSFSTKQPEPVAPPKTPKRPADATSPSLPSMEAAKGGSALTRQPSLLSLAVSPEEYLSSIGKPAAQQGKAALPSASTPSRQVENTWEQPGEITAPPPTPRQDAAKDVTSQPASRVSSFFRSLQEASSSESDSSDEEEYDGYLEEETIPQARKPSTSVKSTRQSSSPEGPSEDEADPIPSRLPSRSSSPANSEHATDSSRILVPAEPPAIPSVQTSTEPEQASETVLDLPSAPPSSKEASESDSDDRSISSAEAQTTASQTPNVQASVSMNPATSDSGHEDIQIEQDMRVEAPRDPTPAEGHPNADLARQSSPIPIPSEYLQSSQSAANSQPVMPDSPTSAISEAAPAASNSATSDAELPARESEGPESVIDGEAPSSGSAANTSSVVASIAQVATPKVQIEPASSNPIERTPSPEPSPREKSPADSEPIKGVSSQLGNGLSEVSRMPSPMDGNDSGTAAVHEAMMLDASENAPHVSTATVQSIEPNAIETDPKSSSSIQTNGLQSSSNASRDRAESPGLFSSIRSYLDRADQSSQVTTATPPRVTSNGHIPEVAVQPASADRGQTAQEVQQSKAIPAQSPRRSPRLAPSSPILLPTSSTTLYPDLTALQEESQSSQPSFAGLSSTASMSEPVQESSQVDELESQTQPAPPRFADVPSSSPIKRYDFDSASQIDMLASQPRPTAAETHNGSKPPSDSQAIHAAVKRVTDITKEGPSFSPTNSTANSDISASDSQDIQDTLVVKSAANAVPLFRPETPSASEESEPDSEDGKASAPSSPAKSSRSRRTSSVSSNSPPVAIYKLQSSPERDDEAEADTTIRNGPLRAIQGHPTSDSRSSGLLVNGSPKRETLSKVFLPPVLPGPPPPPTASPRNASKIIQPEPLGRLTRASRTRHSFGSLSELVEQRTRRGPRPSLASQLSQQSLEATHAQQANGNQAADSSSSSEDDSDDEAAASASSTTSAIPANRFAGGTRSRNTRSATRGRSSLARLTLKPGQRS